jgi:hypothetical protein
MTKQAANPAQTLAGAKTNPSFQGKGVAGAPAPSEDPSDKTWFVPPIVVPVLLLLLVAVRVLALS